MQYLSQELTSLSIVQIIKITLSNLKISYGNRNKKYKKLEGRIYEVDDSFPRIVQSSFKNDKYPNAITHIQYTVDLDGIEYSTW